MIAIVGRPQRLSGLDASFLYLETATQPLQVISVLELDTSTIPGGYGYDRFRRALSTRLRAIPALREKPSNGLFNVDHPVWMADGDFDVNRHVRRIAVPAPGGRAQFEEVCGQLAAEPLDRHRAPWEMCVIEGGHDRLDANRLAVMIKVHHAAADGVTFAHMLSQLCSTEPDPPPPALLEATPAANPLRIAIGGLARFAARPMYLAITLLPATVRAMLDTVRRATRGRAMAAPFTAPRTVLNGSLTAKRALAFARLDLDDVKKVKNHFGVTVNDVVMTLVGGVLRTFLLDRGELPESSLVALVPVSVHESSMPPDRPERNQVSGMYARLHTQIADPAERLRTIAPTNAVAKEHSSAIGATLLQDWCQIIGRATLSVAKRGYARLTRLRPMYNVVVSNVPGPRAHYFLGAEVTAMYPFGPLLHGAGLNITMWSVNGKLHFGVISCPQLLPDPRAIADGLSAGLDQLLAEMV
jgi:WS/DGAT/MGAT family acyltransferase